MQQILLKIRFLKKSYQKPLKKLTLFFPSNPVPFNGKSYQKQKGPGTSDQLLFKLWSKFIKIYLLVIYYLPKFDGNIKWFLSYSKNYICKFMQANSWHHKLFQFHLSFWVWKMWKVRQKITKTWISREQNKFFWWNKKHFSQFLKSYHLVKKKKTFDKKIAETSFKKPNCIYWLFTYSNFTNTD